jgi:hypothetical protein
VPRCNRSGVVGRSGMRIARWIASPSGGLRGRLGHRIREIVTSRTAARPGAGGSGNAVSRETGLAGAWGAKLFHVEQVRRRAGQPGFRGRNRRFGVCLDRLGEAGGWGRGGRPGQRGRRCIKMHWLKQRGTRPASSRARLGSGPAVGN